MTFEVIADKLATLTFSADLVRSIGWSAFKDVRLDLGDDHGRLPQRPQGGDPDAGSGFPAIAQSLSNRVRVGRRVDVSLRRRRREGAFGARQHHRDVSVDAARLVLRVGGPARHGGAQQSFSPSAVVVFVFIVRWRHPRSAIFRQPPSLSGMTSPMVSPCISSLNLWLTL